MAQFKFRGEQDERSIDSNAEYTNWFTDAVGCECQGYTINGKLQGKGLKINNKAGWMAIGYFVGGVPRGDFTRIDSKVILPSKRDDQETTFTIFYII